ncbi:hypothetical protein TI04_06705 [Achromatium sp. WMS2]|nr:hypothetical protein TI04_06705 [Achromatium sp. WMS2]
MPIDGDDHLALAEDSLRKLLNDPTVPTEVRASLSEDYTQVQTMLDKLEHGHVHIAAFGRVSVGKSATLNALLGVEQFSTSPLHGETKNAQMGLWAEHQSGGIFLIDTPGINEVAGESREELAHAVAARADIILFVIDGDLTESELRAMRVLAAQQRPIIVVFNKIDRYTRQDRQMLLVAIRNHTHQYVAPENIVCVSARPAERLVIMVDENGNETEVLRQPKPDTEALRDRLWILLETEGKTLAALNASIFAIHLSDQIAKKILEVKQELGENIIRTWCIAKGIAVAVNPVPLADLAAALAIDVSMIVHLSNIYGLPLTKIEAGNLIKTIAKQMAVVMGATWIIHTLSTILKIGTIGLSTLITSSAQGAVAYYSTYIVGQAAEQYLARGKSWGEGGPKQVIQEILNSIDQDSLLDRASEDIKSRLHY